jgi:hypothetical protein
MAFLLAYCDFAQEWGRKESEIARLNDKRYAHPRLHSLAFENDHSIQTRLVYNFRDFEAGQEHPSSSEIRNWLKSLRNTFSSFNYSFKITYYRLDTESPTAEELHKGEIASIDLQDSYKRKALRKRCNEFLYHLPTGQEVYMTDYSRDVITGAVGIGFGTNDDFVVGGDLDLKLSYNNVDLSGRYKVARADPTKEGLRYSKFVGARRQL